MGKKNNEIIREEIAEVDPALEAAQIECFADLLAEIVAKRTKVPKRILKQSALKVLTGAKIKKSPIGKPFVVPGDPPILALPEKASREDVVHELRHLLKDPTLRGR